MAGKFKSVFLGTLVNIQFVHDSNEPLSQDVLLPMAISKKFPGDTLFSLLNKISNFIQIDKEMTLRGTFHETSQAQQPRHHNPLDLQQLVGRTVVLKERTVSRSSLLERTPMRQIW